MEEEAVKRNNLAIIGLVIGIISSFLINTPITPLIGAAALIISFAGIMEARKTEQGLAYAIVGFILGMFVLVYFFFMR